MMTAYRCGGRLTQQSCEDRTVKLHIFQMHCADGLSGGLSGETFIYGNTGLIVLSVDGHKVPKAIGRRGNDLHPKWLLHCGKATPSRAMWRRFEKGEGAKGGRPRLLLLFGLAHGRTGSNADGWNLV